MRTLWDSSPPVAESWPADWKAGSQTGFIQGLRQYGCDWLASEEAMGEASASGVFPPYVFGVNLCIEGGTFMPVKPLSYFCPVACGCRSGDAHCPNACPIRTAETPTCSAAQSAPTSGTGGVCPISDLRNYGAKSAAGNESTA